MVVMSMVNSSFSSHKSKCAVIITRNGRFSLLLYLYGEAFDLFYQRFTGNNITSFQEGQNDDAVKIIFLHNFEENHEQHYIISCVKESRLDPMSNRIRLEDGKITVETGYIKKSKVKATLNLRNGT